MLPVMLGCTRNAAPPAPVASAKPEAHQEAPQARTLRRAPDVAAEDRQGKSHKLSELAGRPVLLHFWASWCPPCIEELPQFLQMAREFQGKELGFMVVSLDKTWAEADKIFPASAVPPNVLSLLDEAQKSPDALGSYQFPETYLIDRDGQIVEKWVGAQDWQGEGTRKKIAQAMGAARSGK